MPEQDALIGSYQHLEHLPRAAEALHTLRKISSLVKPIMRNHSWRVGILKEFFPQQRNLLGLNVYRGSSICLRLRHAGDNNQFLPLDEVVDTMLHELSHNIHGPHDESFHALWTRLRDEYMDLKIKGYTGEGFLSDGRRLGGRRVPMHELRRQARVAAENRKQRLSLQQGSGQKLGGASVVRGADMRNVIADAVMRRNQITQGCASGTKEAGEISKDADRNGFKTKAEEDEANDRAIAQALWELIQEEEAQKAGIELPRSKIPSELEPIKDHNGSAREYNVHAAPNVSGSQIDKSKVSNGTTSVSNPKKVTAAVPTASKTNPRTRRIESRLLSEDEARRRAMTSDQRQSVDHLNADSESLEPSQPSQSLPREPPTWSCEVCTLVNPLNFLCCDACGVQRPASVTLQSHSHDYDAVVNPSNPSSSGVVKASRLGWNCRSCGSFHEKTWWTCSNCGLMKSSSA